MSFLTVIKVLAGVGVVGGALATPFVLKGLNGKTEHNNSYLEIGFDKCTKLLEDRPRRENDYQIYLCPTSVSNKLEMIYFEEVSGNKSATKIKELNQNFNSRSQPELIITLEGEKENKKTLEWPSLLFEYTNARNTDRTALNPEQDCSLTPLAEHLFTCNSSTWKVIKKNKVK